MTDIMQLLRATDELEANKQDAVLATVVKVEGSAYRRPGARMLIPVVGGAVGTVSGGCLERDLISKAWWLTDSGQPTVRTYSTGAEGDEADEEEDLTFGLGCNGTVHILLERVQHNAVPLPLCLLRQVHRLGAPAALATVIASSDESVRLADRVAIDPTGVVHLSIRQDSLAKALEVDLRAVMLQQRSARQRYSLEGGEVEVLFEYLMPPPRLVVFGAGHDAQPLVSLASQHGWQVTVIDARRHFARRERFPGAVQVLHLELEQQADLGAILNAAAVVIMSHSYRQDRHWLEHALRMRPRYIGQLGPRSRTERLLADIGPSSRHYPGYERLHYPMGLDLGGDTPESVALSVLSELTAHTNGRQGGMLRMREAPIHDCVPTLRG